MADTTHAPWPNLPEGTKVIFKDRKNADGTWTVTERYLSFPDGSRRDLGLPERTDG